MKILLYVFIVIILFAVISNVEITFKPFSISFPYWYRFVGVLLIAIGLMVYCLGEVRNAYRNGYLSGSQFTLSLIKAKAEKMKMNYEKKDNGQSSRDKEMGVEKESIKQ